CRMQATSAPSCAARRPSAPAPWCSTGSAPTRGPRRSCAPERVAISWWACGRWTTLPRPCASSRAECSAPRRAPIWDRVTSCFRGKPPGCSAPRGRGSRRGWRPWRRSAWPSPWRPAPSRSTWRPRPPSAFTRASVDLPGDPELAQDGGGDLLDRLRGRVDAVDSLAPHQLLGGFHFVVAVVQRGVAAVGAALLADLVQALVRDGQAVQLRLLAAQRLGQLAALEILGDQGVVGRLHAELHRQV